MEHGATDKRIAVLAVIVENKGDTAERLNAILHEYADCVIGRMGIPCRDRGVSVMSVVVDAPVSVTSALSGRVGALPGVSVKTAYAK